MILDYITWSVHPAIYDGFVEIRWYGLFFVIGFAFGYYLVGKMFKHEGKPESWLDILLLYLFIATLVGARLGHCLFYQWDLLFATSCRDTQSMGRRPCQPWRCYRYHYSHVDILAARDTRECLVDIGPYCSSHSFCRDAYTIGQPYESRDIRPCNRCTMGIPFYTQSAGMGARCSSYIQCTIASYATL